MAQLVVMAVVAAVEVGLTIYRMLNQPGVKPPAPMRDQFSTSAAGTPINFGYGKDRDPGQVIWTPGIKYTTQKQGGKGGPSSTTYTYYASFAVAFCEGPAKIRRIWFDSKVVYDPTPGSSASYNPDDYPPFDFFETYNIGNVVSYRGQVFRAIALSSGHYPALSPTYWEILSDYPPFDNSATYGPGDVVTYAGQLYVGLASSTGVAPSTNSDDWETVEKYYPAPTIYPGDENQLPDPLIQATEGADRTPAFRGLCYGLWENFPLANFGNRIPNVRVERVCGDSNGPTVVQQGFAQYLEPAGTPSICLTEPIATTDFLIAIARWRPDAGPNPGIADDAPSGGNTWVPEYISGAQKAIWYCDNPKAVASLKIGFTYNGGGFPFNADVAVIHITGQSSYSVTHDSGTTAPISVTNGPYTVTPQDGSAAAVWAGALFVFTDALGHTLQIAPFFDDNGFLLGTSGISGVPIGYAPLFADFLPSWTQIMYNGEPKALLASVVLDLCERAGLLSSDVDVSLLTSAYIKPTDVVSGYSIRQQKTAVEALRVLMTSYFFDGCESDGVIKFIPRGQASVITIPEDDLGLIGDGAKLKPEQIAQEQDLPQLVTVTYQNPARNYEQGKQARGRSTRIVRTKNQKVVDYDLVLTDTQAITIAERLLYLFWLERDTYLFNLWGAKYLLLDPCDVVKFVYDSRIFEARTVESNAGQGLVMEMHLVSEESTTYESSAVPGLPESAVSQSPEPKAVTFLWLFDIPLLRDGDANPGGTGFSFAMGSAFKSWSGGLLNRSADDSSFAEIDKSTKPVTFGYSTNRLGVPAAPWVLDSVNTLTVRQSFGTYASATDDQIAAGANALLVGNPTAGYELLQYKTAVLNLDGSYTLSDLIRGLRGTEWACGFWGDFLNGTNPHAAGDLVLDPYSGLVRHQDNLSLIAALRYYRGVSNGQDIASAKSQSFTNSGNDLRPYAPKNVGGFLDASNNWVITWTRRSRFGDDITVPLGEDSELYELEILNGVGVVMRTVTGLKSPTAIYTVAQQTSDFGTPPSSFSVNVYQISGQIGRGFKGHGAVPGGSSPEVLPVTGFGFYVNGA
jgi:hypothetical protein